MKNYQSYDFNVPVYTTNNCVNFNFQNELLNDVNQCRDIENLIKGDNNESLLNDVIAAAASATTNQLGEDQQCFDTKLSGSTKETLPIQSSPTEGLKIPKATFEIPAQTPTIKPIIPSTSVSPTSATTITSIVPPIVIPSFKVGMGNLNKQNATDKTETLNTTSTSNSGMFSINLQQQGLFY